jgi:hypothetical protein
VAKQLAVAFVLVLSVGCATTSGSQRTPTDDLIEEANGEGVFLESPLLLSPQVRRVVREKIGYEGTEKSRLLKVVRFISDSIGLGFQYQTQSSLTAEKAYVARRGDCMSYANLLVALARTMDVPVRFVRITQLPVTWEAGGRFFESSHMAVALGRDAAWEQAVIVDFGNVHTSPWRFSLYDDVSDEQAFVLFQNNVAVQKMLAGDVESADRILRFFQAHSHAPEIANNLSLVLLQTGKDREALDLLEASVERFPRFRPLFANAVQAARRVGDEDLAKTLEARGRELLEDEPAWNFNEGMRSYHARAYSTAALRFEKALSSDPDNIRLLAWSARAHLAAGNLRRGMEQVERIRSGPPSETRTQLLEDLVHAFPQIEAPVPVAPPPVADRHS